MDPTTTVTIGTALYFSQPYLLKIFGPTCDSFGNELKKIAEKRFQNLENILSKVIPLIEEKNIDNEYIHPRIIYELVNRGSFIDDELSQQYFAGVLASSKTSDGNENGLFYLDLIGKLSSFDIKMHYALYSALRSQYGNINAQNNCNLKKASLKTTVDREQIKVFLCLDKITERLGYEKTSLHLIERIELSGPRLLSMQLFDKFIVGDCTELLPLDIGNDPHGVSMTPSIIGSHLYLWAHGKGRFHFDSIFNPNIW